MKVTLKISPILSYTFGVLVSVSNSQRDFAACVSMGTHGTRNVIDQRGLYFSLLSRLLTPPILPDFSAHAAVAIPPFHEPCGHLDFITASPLP